MARWHIEYCPLPDCDLGNPTAARELPCFRIFPEDNPERWIARTNENLPCEVQEEAAVFLAHALSKALG
jgi:hypothetical protein